MDLPELTESQLFELLGQKEAVLYAERLKYSKLAQAYNQLMEANQQLTADIAEAQKSKKKRAK